MAGNPAGFLGAIRTGIDDALQVKKRHRFDALDAGSDALIEKAEPDRIAIVGRQ
jgi:hypothetical protein